MQLQLQTPAIEHPTLSQGGFNWGAGLGYELRVSETLALGLAYDYRYFVIGDIEEAGYTDVSATLNQLTLQVTLYVS